jgi:hypothetical protein
VTLLLPPRSRRLATLLAAAGATVALAGCGTNVGAQTQDWYDPTDGTNNSAETTLDGMAVRGIVVVSDGSDATVVGTFVNTGADSDGVSSISVEGQRARITGDLDVEPGQSVRLGPPGEARAQASGADLEPGSTAMVEISFDTAPKEELTAIVRAPEGEYEESGPE